MSKWLSIRYRGFWDVPRIFLVRDRGQTFLFECAFSDAIDDYPDEYNVYLLPEIGDADLPADWTTLVARALHHLGKVPVTNVQFDATRRKEMDASILEQFLTAAAVNGSSPSVTTAEGRKS